MMYPGAGFLPPRVKHRRSTAPAAQGTEVLPLGNSVTDFKEGIQRTKQNKWSLSKIEKRSTSDTERNLKQNFRLGTFAVQDSFE